MDPTITVASDQHAGHRVHPHFERLKAEHLAWATPVLDSLVGAGWRDIVVDLSLIDCEVPAPVDTIQVTAVVEAGSLGPVPVAACFVPDRPASLHDALTLRGWSTLLDAHVCVLIASSFDEAVGTRTRVLLRTFEQAGLPTP